MKELDAGVRATEDEISQHLGGPTSVHESISPKACRDKNAIFCFGVSKDVGQSVFRFKQTSRPAVCDFERATKSFLKKFFKARTRFFCTFLRCRSITAAEQNR